MSVTEVIRKGLTYKQFRWNVFFSTQRVTDTQDEINWQGQHQLSGEIKKKWDNTPKKHRVKQCLALGERLRNNNKSHPFSELPNTG